MFELQISQKITKEFIFSKISQESIFEHYLGVPVKKGLFCSPSIIRVDKTPTCSFYKSSKGILYYRDFAGPTFDVIDCVKYIFSCNFTKALKIIANDFGLIKAEKLEKNPPKIQYSNKEFELTEKAKIQVETKEFSPADIKWWKDFGISLTILKKYKVFSIKHVFLNGNYFTSSSDTCPIFGYFGGIDQDGDELWRIYMPTKKKYRFISNWSSRVFQGSVQLPKEGSHLIFVKSLKDTMLLSEFGLLACAPTSENVLPTKNQIEKVKLKFSDNIICFFDNDLPGVKGAQKYRKTYNIRCIFIKRRYSKDISDLYKKVSESVFWEIIDELNQIISNKSLKQTKHFYIFNGKE